MPSAGVRPAPVGLDDDKPFAFELPQRFAHKGSAHSHHIAKFAFDQTLAGLKPADSYSGSHAFGDAVPQRTRDTIHPEIQTANRPARSRPLL
jgi:hypothetical protein